MCQEPFTQMVHKYQNLVFSICVKMTGDYFAAEDLTQETFLSAYQHKEEFDGKNEKAWLCRIASNKCIDYSRQAARRMVPTEDEVLGSHPARAGGPEEQCIEEVVREELQEKCGQLKPPYDEIAKLYFCEEHPAGEMFFMLPMIDASIDRVEEIDRAPRMDEGGSVQTPKCCDISFDHVDFSY